MGLRAFVHHSKMEFRPALTGGGQGFHSSTFRRKTTVASESLLKDSAAEVSAVPAKLSLSRRNMLWGSAATLLGLGVAAPARTLLAAEASPPLSTPGSASLPAAGSDAPMAQFEVFMKVSRLATGHENLDSRIGQRLHQALATKDGEFQNSLGILQAVITKNHVEDVESLDALLRGQPLHDTLMAIIRAWYSGVVEPGSFATVYAFERALMYQPPRDGMVIPTYAHNGPNYWVAEPPPLDRMPSF